MSDAPVTDVKVLDHPAAGAALADLRDEATAPGAFRESARRLGLILAVEATRNLPTTDRAVTSPLAATTERVPARPVVAVPVLRAGLGLLEALQQVVPDVAVGMLGMERDPTTHEPREYYAKLPPLEGASVLVLEPMLATGGSAGAAVAALLARGADQVTVVSVVATQQAIDRIAAESPGTAFVVGAIDPELDDRAYIVPGLGDFGDRLYGTPH